MNVGAVIDEHLYKFQGPYRVMQGGDAVFVTGVHLRPFPDEQCRKKGRAELKELVSAHRQVKRRLKIFRRGINIGPGVDYRLCHGEPRVDDGDMEGGQSVFIRRIEQSPVCGHFPELIYIAAFYRFVELQDFFPWYRNGFLGNAVIISGAAVAGN